MRKSDLSPRRQLDLKPVPGRDGVFSLSAPSLDEVDFNARGVSEALWAAQEALGRLSELMRSGINENLIVRTLDRKEAVLSSRIEGTQADLEDLLEYELTKDEEGKKPDTRQVYGYLEALRCGIESLEAGGDLTTSLIQKIHQVLMRQDDQYRDVPGEFRTLQNWIGGLKIQDARYVPPQPDEIPSAMKDLESFMRGESHPYKNVILNTAITHAQFEAIHPFRDGNGRTGRLLIPLILKKNGYAPLYVAGELYKRRSEYFEALLGVQLNLDWTTWIKFYAECFKAACENAIEISSNLKLVRASWEEKAFSVRADSVLHKIQDLIIREPVVDVKKVAKAMECSYPSANNALLKLVEMKILEMNDSKRNRVFYANDVLSVLVEKTLEATKKRKP